MKTSMTLLLVSSLVLTSNAFAVEVISDARASVTVANSFDFTNPVELNFGTIRAVNDATETASLVLDPSNGSRSVSTTGGNALIALLDIGTAAEFLIENAAPSSELTIVLPSTPINLNPMAVPGGPGFVVTNFVAYLPSKSRVYSAPGDLFTEPDGTATFRVGATLTTDNSVSTAAYATDEYEGFYRIEVQY